MVKQRKRQDIYQSSERSGKGSTQWLDSITSAYQAIRSMAKTEETKGENKVFNVAVTKTASEPILAKQGAALIRMLKPLLREMHKKPQEKLTRKAVAYKEDVSDDDAEGNDGDSGSVYEPSDNGSSSSGPDLDLEPEPQEGGEEKQAKEKRKTKKRKAVLKPAENGHVGGPIMEGKPPASRLPFAAGDLLSQAKKLKTADADAAPQASDAAKGGSKKSRALVATSTQSGGVTAAVLQAVTLRRVPSKKQLVPPSTKRVRLRGNASGKKGIPRQTNVGEIRAEETSSKTIGQFLRKALEDKFKTVRQVEETPMKDDPWSPIF